MAGLDEKGPNLFSGRPSTPSPAKRPTTVWPSSYNPYYTKRTERPPPPSEERVERPEQKLRGGQSTGEACILSSGPPSPALSFVFYIIALLFLIIIIISIIALSLCSPPLPLPPPLPPRFSTPRTQTQTSRAHTLSSTTSTPAILAAAPEPLFATRYSALVHRNRVHGGVCGC